MQREHISEGRAARKPLLAWRHSGDGAGKPQDDPSCQMLPRPHSLSSPRAPCAVQQGSAGGAPSPPDSVWVGRVSIRGGGLAMS